MKPKKLLFIDRDGTLIEEPCDEQIDSIEKLALMPGVISALLQLKAAGYSFVMISNQDGLGTESFPHIKFQEPHEFMLRIFASQGIYFEDIRICPHHAHDFCDCRKPKIGLVLDYLAEQKIDREHSYVIGDRETDLKLAMNMGIQGIRIAQDHTPTWEDVAHKLLSRGRSGVITRKTQETEIIARVDLDRSDLIQVKTGIGFFDHMLEQLAKHGGFSLSLFVKGDLHIDDHHTVEDAAIVLGSALRKALGDKIGIGRYGFLLPMDESLAHIAIDLSGRSHLSFDAIFTRERVGDLSTELVSHFFRSLADSLRATIHIQVKGENTHHMIESIFKGIGRTLRQAITQVDLSLPTTKGIL